MIKGNTKKVIVHILYPCFVCAEEYQSASQVIQHVKNVHGYILISRPTGYHRPQDKHYNYESGIRNRWDVQHSGCPSCWFHAPKDMETILQHIMEVHEPSQIEGFVHKHEKDEDELYEEESDQEVADTNGSQNTPTVDEIKKEEERERSTSARESDGDVTEDEKDKDQEHDNNEANANNHNYSSSKNTKYTLLESEEELLHQTFQKLTELSQVFKKLFNQNEN